MRAFVVATLVCAIGLCPFLCGASDAGECACDGRAGCGAADPPASPVHCPDEGGSCVCQGAIRLLETRGVCGGLAALTPADFDRWSFDLLGGGAGEARERGLGADGVRAGAGLVKPRVWIPVFRC